MCDVCVCCVCMCMYVYVCVCMCTRQGQIARANIENGHEGRSRDFDMSRAAFVATQAQYQNCAPRHLPIFLKEAAEQAKDAAGSAAVEPADMGAVGKWGAAVGKGGMTETGIHSKKLSILVKFDQNISF